MAEPDSHRVQCLTRKLDWTQGVGPVRVPRLSYQRVSVNTCLQTDLITPPCHQRHPEHGGFGKPLDRAIAAMRVLSPWVARVRLLLYKGGLVPDQPVAPLPRRWGGMAVDHGQIHPLGLTAPKLALQPL